ncbi:MAG: rhomboid family intramembrane serine protease [Candidatus Thermoplasmatota archaeon]
MDVNMFQLHLVSIIAICLMIISLFLAYLKKWLVTYSLMVANFLVFLISIFFRGIIINDLGFRPIYFSFEYLPKIYTIFTSMFVHAGFLHILGNMIVFFFIGMAFEQRVGWKKFLIIYLLSGVFGTVVHSALNLGSFMPVVGASGAIFGLMGAFAFSFPQDKVVMPIPIGFFMILRRVRVITAVIIFIAFETFLTFFSGAQDNTAHFAHFGGLIGGMILAALLIRGKTHHKSGETIYFDSRTDTTPSEINFSNLRQLSTTPQQQKLLQQIENESVSDVRDAWLEHFLDKSNCPQCGNPLVHHGRKVWCEKCGFKTKY